MHIKALPIKGTTMHVWDRKKYYPGVVYEVDDELGKVLISRRIAERIEAPKRPPGRPKKSGVFK